MALTPGRLPINGDVLGTGNQRKMNDFVPMAHFPNLNMTLPAVNAFANMTFSDPPTAAQMNTLKTELEKINAAVRTMQTTFNDFKAKFQTSTGLPVFNDT